MSWRVKLDSVWDVLGPFPVHAREQHFLSPAYPLDLSLPIDTTIQYPTSLTHTARAAWSQTTADPHGTIKISHPSVPWQQIRATEGWAGLQHVNVLRGWLSVHSSSDISRDTSSPLLRTALLHGAFFAILPPPHSPERKTHVPEWHYGNIYSLERAPAQLVRFPVSPEQRMKYEVIICAPYEIRLFGDPSSYSSPHPILTINFSVSLQFPPTSESQDTDSVQCPIEGQPLQQVLAHSISPFIVDGTPFGDAIGIGVLCLDFSRPTEQGKPYWSIVRARLAPTSAHLLPSMSVSLLDELPVRIAPTQTRLVPLRLRVSSSSERISERVEQLDVELTCVFQPNQTEMHLNTEHMPQSPFVLRATLPLTHVPCWTRETQIPIRASYFFQESMPTIFLVKPPKEAIGDSQAVLGHHEYSPGKCKGNEPILALHGAGVDIHTQSFWPDSLLRQKYAWVVMPEGRTAWGLDWHGPSAADAFATVSALSHILFSSGAGRWAKWGFNADTPVILMGHSNGGQGAWYMASRWPDRVCAVVPAAGYIKSQAYVSWCMSRFAHFIDPVLRCVLDSSLTPDDNDLFLGNLVGKPVLALHGEPDNIHGFRGADDNVPVWETREQVGILKTWDPDADVTYFEGPGQPHWYFEILYNERVQAFLDRVYFSSSGRKAPSNDALGSQRCKTIDFTLTVAVPAESGSLNGWQILVLTIPGLLGRLRVTTTPDGYVSVRTTNVTVFSLDLDVWATILGDTKKALAFAIDGDAIPIDFNISDATTILIVRDANAVSNSHWKISSCPDLSTTALCTPPRRLQSILCTHGPLTLVVPSLAPSLELSAALRIAHALHLFHALDARIIGIAEVEAKKPDPGVLEGNLVVIGCADSPIVHQWLQHGIWSYTNKTWHVNGACLDRPSSAILFCHPHPYNDKGAALFIQSTDLSGLERAVRLFPIRTGVLLPDWLVVDGRADTIGAAAVQGAGVYGNKPHDFGVTHEWLWNERMSWLD